MITTMDFASPTYFSLLDGLRALTPEPEGPIRPPTSVRKDAVDVGTCRLPCKGPAKSAGTMTSLSAH